MMLWNGRFNRCVGLLVMYYLLQVDAQVSPWTDVQSFRFSSLVNDYKYTSRALTMNLESLTRRKSVREAAEVAYSFDEFSRTSASPLRQRLCFGAARSGKGVKCTSSNDCRRICDDTNFECITCPACDGLLTGRCYIRTSPATICPPLDCTPSDSNEAKPSELDCFVGGCGGSICAAERIYGTCEYRPEDECYRLHGTCGHFGVQGACDWKPSRRLQRCIESHRNE